MEVLRREFLSSASIAVTTAAGLASARRSGAAVPVSGDVRHRRVRANGISLHIAEQGEGPLVLLCHGFPESWYSWRWQLSALAGAGFHAVAPDMRGYAQSDVPPEIASYTIMHLVGDMVGLVTALEQKEAVIIGHDWGATVAWHAALLRPDMFRAVVAMSVPFRQRGPAPPLRLLREEGLFTHYWLYYQDEGPAEAEFGRDPRATLRQVLFTGSGDAPRGRPPLWMLQVGKGALDNRIDPEHLPPWLTEADLDYMAADFARAGFRGGLNYYRNIDRNWELLAPWAGGVVRRPALFIAGTQDSVLLNPKGRASLDAMGTTVPNLRRQVLIDDAGHYIQQERPAEVNALLTTFLHDVSAA